MQNKLLLLGICLSLSFYGQSQINGFQWGHSYGGASEVYANDVAQDNGGNIYVVGTFSGVMDADPNSGTSALTSNGGKDFYIQKINAAGELIWAKSFGSTGLDEAFVIRGTSVSPGSNSSYLYIGGTFNNTVDFAPDVPGGELSAGPGPHAFIMKIDTNGKYIWTKSFGPNTGEALIYDLAIDQEGSVVSTGSFFDTCNFTTGSASDFSLISKGHKDAFVTKFDSNGVFKWAVAMGGKDTDIGFGITVDYQGNVISGGCFMDSCDFDPSSKDTFYKAQKSYDGYIWKLDKDGAYIWNKTIPGEGGNLVYALEYSVRNTIVSVGYFHLTSDIDPTAEKMEVTSKGGRDIFINALTDNGTQKWSKTIGSPGDEEFVSIEEDQNQELWFSGYMFDSLDLDPSANTQMVYGKGNTDAILAKFDFYGNYIMGASYGSEYVEFANGVTFDSDNDVYVIGGFQDTMTIDTNGRMESIVANGNFYYDAFTIKYRNPIIWGLDDKEFSKMVIYPNPNNGLFYVDAQELASNASFRVLDQMGRTVEQGEIAKGVNTIRLKQATKGFYYLQVGTSNGLNYHSKIVVQ